METKPEPDQNLILRAITIADLPTIVKIYKQQKNATTKLKSPDMPLTDQFGLPFFVAERDSKIIAYSYVMLTSGNNYNLNAAIDSTLSGNSIVGYLIKESEIFFKQQCQKGMFKNLNTTTQRLINWLNNTYQ
ncbi:hypothetical protein ACSV4D_11605 [Flavobacterium sp. ARAG 55.4]|uniref:hypothetical protein n=1 Tax=Flavobacterium sp. ARAG 55.4 TaxID=3451357 RepID=UPI003F47E79E